MGNTAWPSAGPKPRAEEDMLQAQLSLSQALSMRRGEIGIVHLDLHGDARGLIVGWCTEMYAVAEPGQACSEFLESVNGGTGPCPSLQHLCERRPRFEVNGVLHTYASQHLQEVALSPARVVLFRRTLPRTHITELTIRGMVGEWRDLTVVSSGLMQQNLLSSLMYAGGAKAVIAPALRLEYVRASDQDLGEFFTTFYSVVYSGKVTIEEALEIACTKHTRCAYFRVHMLLYGTTPPSPFVVDVSAGAFK
eukprot:gene4864-5940_t